MMLTSRRWVCLTHLCCSHDGLAVLSRAAAGGPGVGSGEESWTFHREPDSLSRVQERDMMETRPPG